jgi:hypothetical protein
MRRSLSVDLNRDRDYPRAGTSYYRNRWSWRAMLSNESVAAPFGIYEGRAAFALTALIKAHFPTRFGKKVDTVPSTGLPVAQVRRISVRRGPDYRGDRYQGLAGR